MADSSDWWEERAQLLLERLDKKYRDGLSTPRLMSTIAQFRLLNQELSRPKKPEPRFSCPNCAGPRVESHCEYCGG